MIWVFRNNTQLSTRQNRCCNFMPLSPQNSLTCWKRNCEVILLSDTLQSQEWGNEPGSGDGETRAHAQNQSKNWGVGDPSIMNGPYLQMYWVHFSQLPMLEHSGHSLQDRPRELFNRPKNRYRSRRRGSAPFETPLKGRQPHPFKFPELCAWGKALFEP